MQHNAAAAAALHELATRDQMFPRHLTPTQGDVPLALTTWIPTIPTLSLMMCFDLTVVVLLFFEMSRLANSIALESNLVLFMLCDDAGIIAQHG